MWAHNHSTIDAKTSFYRGDGSGRDGYVLRNSGGFIRDGLPSYTGSNWRPQSSHKSPSARLDGKPLHYHSDGSGRDKYIVTDCGGMVRNFNPDNFWNGVRSYDRCRTTMNNSKDYFGWAQRSGSPQARLETIKKSNQVKNMLTRLTSPEPKVARSASLRKPAFVKSPLNKSQQQFGKSMF